MTSNKPRVVAVVIAIVLAGVLVYSMFEAETVWTPLAPLAAVVGPWHYAMAGLIVALIFFLFRAAFGPPPGETRWVQLERQAWVTTGLVFTAATTAFLWAWQYLNSLADPSKRPDVFAILITGATATAAILVQVHLENRRQSKERRDADHRRRRDFTHNALQEFRTDREVQEHRANVRHEYPDRVAMTEDELARHYVRQMDPASYEIEGAASVNAPVLDSVTAILAFYEQLAADIYDDVHGGGDTGSLDEKLLLDTLEPPMTNLFMKTLQYIKVQWRASHQTYERLRWLINRWSLQKEDEGTKRQDEPPYATREWRSDIWSEDGPDERIEHGADDAGPWGGAALRDLALKGLQDWPADRPSDRLLKQLLAYWRNDAEFMRQVKHWQAGRVEVPVPSKPDLIDVLTDMKTEVAKLRRAVHDRAADRDA